MILSSRIDLQNNRYVVTIGLDTGPDALTDAESKAIAAFGEPIVDIGGAFTGDVNFTLTANELRFPSQFPIRQIFAKVDDDDEDAVVKAEIFRGTILTRLDAAVTAKAVLPATGTGRWTDTISTITS